MSTNILTIVGVAAASGLVGGVVSAGFVNLQDSSPGTAQTGHINVTGNVRAGNVGVGAAPSLARVQVAELGSGQGVRATTSSGVSIYGQNLAASGLGAGGYFTTNSIGGRAMVGDALSGTGNTVGGLFYNRSTGGGVGVWGRAIGAGTATGVFGETTSATGTALAASNSGSGNSLTAGTQNDTLLTEGDLPRHRYTVGTASTMVPIAYGYISTAGGISSGSGNFTIANQSVGVVDIDIQGYTSNSFDATIVASAVEDDGSQFAAVQRLASTTDFRIICFDTATSAPANSDVTFVVYRSTGIAAPPKPNDLANPPGLRRGEELHEWQKRDPRGYAAWHKKNALWQETARARPGYSFPVDTMGSRP